MRNKGSIIVECLMAAGFAALALPPAAAFFSDALDAALEFRRRQEAMSAALSCIDAAEYGSVEITKEWVGENIAAGLASYDISVSQNADGLGRQCSVSVCWTERGRKREVRLVRRLR